VERLRLAQSKPVEPIPKEIKSGTELLVTPEDQAEAFAGFFKAKVEKVVTENQINQHVNNGTRLVECGDYNFFTLDLVLKIMMELKSKPSFGSDSIASSEGWCWISSTSNMEADEPYI
jgi:hypothetical protein